MRGLGRLLLVCGAALAVAGLTLAHRYAAALAVGTVAGAFFFLRGMAAGGGLGNARRAEHTPADVSARIGVALAASGLASASLGHDPPFPPPFRAFYGVCLVAGCAGALFLAVKAMRDASVR